VIFTILTAFICLTVQLFYLINNIRHGFQSDKSVLAAAASCSLIFTHILELWVIFISGHRVKDMWTGLIKRVQFTKRQFAADEKFKAQIDELVSIMVFTRIEMKAAGLFNIDLSVITSVSGDCRRAILIDR
jgi:gustatory receptor